MQAIRASRDGTAGVPLPLTILFSQHKSVALQRLAACCLHHTALCDAR
jgi:hypothetical protein